jgi:hypothetical protein
MGTDDSNILRPKEMRWITDRYRVSSLLLDGKFSKTEFFAIYKDKDKAEKNFKTWDLNKDGFITEEEYISCCQYRQTAYEVK